MYLKTKEDTIQACWEIEKHVTKATNVNHTIYTYRLLLTRNQL